MRIQWGPMRSEPSHPLKNKFSLKLFFRSYNLQIIIELTISTRPLEYEKKSFFSLEIDIASSLQHFL